VRIIPILQVIDERSAKITPIMSKYACACNKKVFIHIKKPKTEQEDVTSSVATEDDKKTGLI
jgi:hypothetical protein